MGAAIAKSTAKNLTEISNSLIVENQVSCNNVISGVTFELRGEPPCARGQGASSGINITQNCNANMVSSTDAVLQQWAKAIAESKVQAEAGIGYVQGETESDVKVKLDTFVKKQCSADATNILENSKVFYCNVGGAHVNQTGNASADCQFSYALGQYAESKATAETKVAAIKISSIIGLVLAVGAVGVVGLVIYNKAQAGKSDKNMRNSLLTAAVRR